MRLPKGAPWGIKWRRSNLWWMPPQQRPGSSSARYEKGTDIYLNVLDAQRSLYAAQQGLITIRLAQLANQVQLYAVLGGGGDSVTPDEGA